MHTVTSAEAQNRFGEVLDRAQREPVAITRHGRPVAYLVGALQAEDPQLLAQRRAEAAQWYAEYCRSIAPGANAEAAQRLTDADVNALVHELR